MICEPAHVRALNACAVAMGVGFRSSFAVTAEGELYAWGELECAYFDFDGRFVKSVATMPENVGPAHGRVIPASVSFGNMIVVTDKGVVFRTHIDYGY